MKIIIDILLLIIIALCTWNGYKRGLVGGVAGILAIIIALFGGSLLSSAYAHEVVPALEPFVDGYIDSQDTRDAVLEKLGYGESDLSLEDILAQDSSLRYDYAYECMRTLGFYEKRADDLASDAVALADANSISMTDAVVAVLCDTITYVGALVIAFLLILIFLVAIGNVGNLSFRLPNMEALDEVGGAVLGFGKAFIYCVLFCWLLSFLGMIIGQDTMEHTTLGRFFLMFDFLTNGLM
ncbi:MAG TPA: CvpA family protein [Candidatus Limivicinus faecipullorum]|nr:CvpA family protein [Candidatus Limivicinus faecipullorum]